MTYSPNQPESWETELRDAASTIPDAAPDVVDGMEALRHALVEHTIGLYEALGWPADIDPDDALAKAAELRAENDRLFVRWKMARAEVDRLRSRIADAHKVADRLQSNYVLPIMADALRDALDGPQSDPARETALDEMAYESARETTDFAAHWPINTREEQPRVPQPGDRVRVTWRKDGEFISSGRFTEDTVDANGDYTGVSDVQDGWASVEVIEPAPAAASAATGQRAFGLFAIGDRDGARAELAAANLKTLLAIGDIAHALNELVVDVLRSRPADAGKETDR